MAQYAEGQHLHGSDGRLYVVHNGVPVVAPPTPLISSPTLLGELRAQQDTHAKSALDIQKTAGTLAADEQTAKSQAISSGIKAKSDQIDLNVKMGTPPGDPSRTGAAYLATLPEGVRDLANAMLANRYPATINRNIPVVNQAVLAANHVNPAFDSTRYNMRVALMNKTLAGNDADELKALNAALGHANVLYDQAAKLPGGADYGIGPLTHGINAYHNWLNSTSPGYKNFLDTMQKYGQEESKVYGVNTGGGQQQTQANYDINDPGATIQSNIKNDVRLMAGRAAAILNKYNLGNAGQAPLEPLDPQARAALQRLAPDAVNKFFSARPDPLAQAMGIAIPGGPGSPPPPSGPGYAPPPTGPTNGGSTPSTDGFNDTPDPQDAAFWTAAVHQGTPYRDALNQWQADVKARGLVGITPPPADKYQQAVDYIAKHPNIPYQPFSSITRTPVDPLHQVATNAAFSGPGVAVGHAVNALGANIPTLLAGDQGARYNAVSNATHPNYALGGDIAGTVAGALGAQKLVEGAAPYLGAYGKIMAPNAARAALTGDTAFFGASGAAANPDHPVLGAAGGMASGMAGNAFGRYLVGPGIRAALDTGIGQDAINGLGKGVSALKGMFGGGQLTSFNPPAALDAGQNMIFKRANPALDKITGKLQSASVLGLPYALADADPRLQALAGSAARKSPDALALANQALVPRQAGQAERAIAQINSNLAPVGDVPTMQANILKQAQKQSGPLYDAAKGQSAPELTANPALKEALDRPAAQAAIRKGYETALNNGEDVGTLTYATDPQGNPVQYGNPSWNVIHHARRVLDANGDTAVRHALDKQIATINPGIKAADAAYSTVLKGSDALQAGADATKIGVTPEQAQAALNSSAKNTPQFQQGYASDLADQIERSRLSGNPYNLVHGSLGQQAKMNMIFPQGAANFGTAHALENDMASTYREALGGSQTAARTEADKAFDHAGGIATDLAMAPVTHGASLTGLGMTGVRKALGYLSDRTQLGMSAAKANGLAPYLLNTDPHANLILLNDIAGQQAARQAYLQKFGAMTGNVGSGMFAAPFIYGANGQ